MEDQWFVLGLDVELERLAQHEPMVARFLSEVTRQSIQATAPSRIGEPEGPCRHCRSANLSPPEAAKRRATSAWCSLSTFTQKRPVARIGGQLVDVREGQTATRGGSSDRHERAHGEARGPAATGARDDADACRKVPHDPTEMRAVELGTLVHCGEESRRWGRANPLGRARAVHSDKSSPQVREASILPHRHRHEAGLGCPRRVL